MKIKPALLASLAVFWLAADSPAHAGDCYILKSAKGETLYNAETPPFDLGFPPFSKEYARSRARGERLLIEAGNECYREEESTQRQEQAEAIAWARRQAASQASFVGYNGTTGGAGFPPVIGNAQPAGPSVRFFRDTSGSGQWPGWSSPPNSSQWPGWPSPPTQTSGGYGQWTRGAPYAVPVGPYSGGPGGWAPPPSGGAYPGGGGSHSGGGAGNPPPLTSGAGNPPPLTSGAGNPPPLTGPSSSGGPSPAPLSGSRPHEASLTTSSPPSGGLSISISQPPPGGRTQYPR